MSIDGRKETLKAVSCHRRRILGEHFFGRKEETPKLEVLVNTLTSGRSRECHFRREWLSRKLWCPFRDSQGNYLSFGEERGPKRKGLYFHGGEQSVKENKFNR